MGILFTAIVVWDVILATNTERGDTISEVTKKLGSYSIFFILWLAFGMGLLAGHFFWPQGP